MAFIDYISFETASDKLKKLYRLWAEPDSTLDNIVKIAIVVSGINQCHY